MTAKQIGIAFLNFLLFWAATLLLAHFEGILWYQVFGSFPAPALWLLPMVYLSQHRGWIAGLFQVYGLCLAMATVTVMPVGFLMVSCGLVFLTTMSFKGRIYWEGSSFHLLVAGVAVMSFHFYSYILSWIFETSPIVYPDLLHWIPQAILTAALSPGFQHLFGYFDSLTGHEQAVESEMQVP